MPSYRRLQQYAIAISIASVFYNGAEGGISIGFGAESSSRSLIFFGIQSAIEVASAAVVIWRFKNLAKPGEEKRAILAEREIGFEKRATLVIGVLLLALFVGTEASSIASLVLHQEPDSSNSSLIISASALVLMVLIWLPKRYLARALDSSAMKGEAICSLSCIQMTIVLFIGSLIFRLWKGGWWVDAATAIVLGFLFGWEGIKMVMWARDPEFSGGCCKDCKFVAVDDQMELGEQYRDICNCCLEKEECRQSDRCKCSFARTEGEEPLVISIFTPEGQRSYSPEIRKSQRCCSPVSPNGEMCCTRAVLPRSRSDSRPPVVAQPGLPNCDAGCTSTPKDSASKDNTCCSSKAGEAGCDQSHSVPDKPLPDVVPPFSISDSSPSGGDSSLHMPTTEKTACCGGCRS